MVPGFGSNITPAGISGAFGDPETVRRWWTGRHRRAHVGVLTGRSASGSGPGLLVIDLDMAPEGVAGTAAGGADDVIRSGADVIERLAAEAGQPWPDTYTVLTPSGGMHLYYLMPTDGPPIGCAVGDGAAGPHLGPLVDVRGLGGLVIAAGSTGTAGTYRCTTPGERPAPVPAWLLSLLRRPAPARPAPAAPVIPLAGRSGTRADAYATAALRGELERVAAAPDGTRNNQLFASARRLGELANSAPGVLEETAVHDALLAAVGQAGGRGDRRDSQTIRNGWSRGAADSQMGGAA